MLPRYCSVNLNLIEIHKDNLILLLTKPDWTRNFCSGEESLYS